MTTNNIKIIIIAIIAAAVGLSAGYLLFGKNKTMEHHHEEKVSATSSAEEIWTCSMHPQIRQPEPGDCAICGMDLIPLEENSSDDPLVLEMTEAAAKLANIQTTVIGSSSESNGKVIPLSGKVQADERLASSLVAHLPGRIEKLYISFTGERVEVGQKLAKIYAPDLITAQRELIEAVKLKDLNPGLLEAARNKLRYWKIGEHTIKNIEQKEIIEETFEVYAEAAGIVTNKRVAVGDYVKKGEALFDVMNLQKVWVLFDAYEEELANFAIGDKIEFRTSAVPNKSFKTRISFIDPVINPTTRVASIRTEYDNAKGWLKPEMLVTGSLQKRAKTKTALTVPKSAVLWTGKRSVVYVKVPDTTVPSFKYREVELGENLGTHYQVVEGLSIGEEVVTNGSFTIDAAAQLNNQASMMNKDVQLKKEEEQTVVDYQATTPDAFKQQLHSLVEAYMPLKDALVATDAAEATNLVTKFITQLDQLEAKGLDGEAQQYWMEQDRALKVHSKKILALKDVEKQREQFDFLSDALILSIDAFGIIGSAVYLQYCPMAFDDEGADWLALEEQIQNPYFGDKMMRCGVVKKTY